MGGKIDNIINKGRGPYTFRLSGQNYHSVGSLLPAVGCRPSFAQLYFYDTENELSNRLSLMQDGENHLQPDIIAALISMLDAHNSLTKTFRIAKEWCENNNYRDLKIRLLGERNVTGRQYTQPQVKEIAALIVGDFVENCDKRDIIIHSTYEGLQRISELHPMYMALQYPLLFPYAEDGYSGRLPYADDDQQRTTKRSFVTMREYYAYRIQQRENEGQTLIKGGRLFQQYLVDAYTAIEAERLRWLRFNQKQLRAELYNNLQDAVTRGDMLASAVGKRIVLPSSFTASPRYHIQNFHDAMAVCRMFGNPTLFITMTANPKWPEIAEFLSSIPGQNITDRPDIVSRIFKLKLNSLIKDLQTNCIFGKTTAVIYTVEFQKRGLPHAHILCWLQQHSSPISNLEDIDTYISAEIPDPNSDPAAHKLVTDFMLHGPCGQYNKSAPCMKEGKCTKYFPKPFQQITKLTDDGFPLYRRRKNGYTFKRGTFELDNRYVIPYNRQLLLKYQCHINVEWCNKAGSIKYLFKYVNKGPDRVTVLIQENAIEQRQNGGSTAIEVDEIKQYLDCRYISASEASWRIFSYDIHYSNPPVMRLTFHLPNEQPIITHDGALLPDLLNRERIQDTMFTEWFKLNSSDPAARRLLYSEIPSQYVWKSEKKTWFRRQRGRSVGRITYCHPTAGERYYLRILLNKVRGPKNFEDIRTVNGRVEPTFKAACSSLGLINDDKEWEAALDEGSFVASAKQLRELFVTILVFCEVISPLALWLKFWEPMTEDFVRMHEKNHRTAFSRTMITDEQRKNYCLLELENLLGKNGKSLTDYPDLPLPDHTMQETWQNKLLQEELSYDCTVLASEHQQLYNSLNKEQIIVYNNVMDAITNTL